MLEHQDFNKDQPVDPKLSKLSEDAARLGHDIVSIAGFLSDVDAKSSHQLQSVVALSSQAHEVLSANRKVRQALGDLLDSSQNTLGTVQSSVDLVRRGGNRSKEIAEWVQGLSEQMTVMAQALHSVLSSNEEIASIASQVNILAINAKIEAARAGDAGRGFAVVAEAINELSGKTAKAAENISVNVTHLSEQVDQLNKETSNVATQAKNVLTESQEADDAMGRIAEAATASSEKTNSTISEAETVREAVENFLPAFDQIGDSVGETARGVHLVTEQADSLVDLSETIVQDTVALGGVSQDGVFIARVQSDAAQISNLLEEAVTTGRISLEALFSRRYTAVAGSNPAQVMAPFTDLADRLFPPILEAALDLGDNVVFCAAIDTSGYLPTHNVKFSHPQGNDPDWNMANCRNRRIFDDRVGLKAGRSTAPFLLQVYRRDMGGGVYAMMKDISAPIIVRGRHWGGLRLAYRFD